MAKYFRIYKTFIRAAMLKLMAYRFDLAMSAVANIMWTIAQVISLQFMFSRIQQFQGWEIGDLILLLAFGQIYVYTGYIIYLGNFLNLSNKVIKGELDFLLLKPVNLKFFVSFEYISIAQIPPMLITVIPMLLFGFAGQQNVTGFGLLSSFVIMVLGIMILYFLALSLAGLTFFLDSARQILEITTSMTDITRVPLDILPKGAQFAFTFVLPMAFVTYYPVLALKLDTDLFNVILAELSLLIIAILTSQIIWRYGLKSYSGVG